MDELAASLQSSFSVSNEPNTTAAPHPRYAQYKQKSSSSDQECRRKSILEKQKSRRFDFTNHVRRLAENAWEKDNLEKEDGDAEETMDDSQVQVFHKPGRYYKNQLMLSEWMVEVPSDLTEEWLMVVCPVGKRCLVVASRGTTTAYARNGYRLNNFPSWLPGGNRNQNKFKDNAILDCIYHEVDKTFYVLDIMCWKSHPVYDSETEFRLYWLKSRFEETPEATIATNMNPYKFVPLPYCTCQEDEITSLLNNTSQEVDGCLFYHKRVCYTFGAIPLVLWLKPYMFPEILGLEVSQRMMEQKPAQYLSHPQYMQHLKDVKEKIAAERENNTVSPQRGRGRGRGGGWGKRGRRRNNRNGRGMEATEMGDGDEMEEGAVGKDDDGEEEILTDNTVEHNTQCEAQSSGVGT